MTLTDGARDQREMVVAPMGRKPVREGHGHRCAGVTTRYGADRRWLAGHPPDPARRMFSTEISTVRAAFTLVPLPITRGGPSSGHRSGIGARPEIKAPRRASPKRVSRPEMTGALGASFRALELAQPAATCGRSSARSPTGWRVSAWWRWAKAPCRPAHRGAGADMRPGRDALLLDLAGRIATIRHAGICCENHHRARHWPSLWQGSRGWTRLNRGRCEAQGLRDLCVSGLDSNYSVAPVRAFDDLRAGLGAHGLRLREKPCRPRPANARSARGQRR